MGDSSVFVRVRDVIYGATGFPLDGITPEASLISDLNFEDVDFLDVITDLEDEFEIQMRDKDVNEITMQKVSDLVKYIEEHLK